MNDPNGPAPAAKLMVAPQERVSASLKVAVGILQRAQRVGRAVVRADRRVTAWVGGPIVLLLGPGGHRTAAFMAGLARLSAGPACPEDYVPLRDMHEAVLRNSTSWWDAPWRVVLQFRSFDRRIGEAAVNGEARIILADLDDGCLYWSPPEFWRIEHRHWLRRVSAVELALHGRRVPFRGQSWVPLVALRDVAVAMGADHPPPAPPDHACDDVRPWPPPAAGAVLDAGARTSRAGQSTEEVPVHYHTDECAGARVDKPGGGPAESIDVRVVGRAAEGGPSDRNTTAPPPDAILGQDTAAADAPHPVVPAEPPLPSILNVGSGGEPVMQKAAVGRKTHRPLMFKHWHDRVRSGACKRDTTLAAEAKAISVALGKAHPSGKGLSPNTIENNLRHDFDLWTANGEIAPYSPRLATTKRT